MCQKKQMSRIKLENDKDILEKLKEVNIISKTKSLNVLSQIVYKSIDENGQVIPKKCK